MKYLRVISPRTSQSGDYGILRDGRISLLSGPPFENGSKETGTEFGIEEVRVFLPPAEPPNVIAVGLNYRGHAAESGMEQPEEPVLFLKATSSLTGHLSPVRLPAGHPDEVDYEAELAAVIGKETRNVAEDEAAASIFGFTCANDVSARDCQLRLDRQWARAKSFDTFCPLGPWIETEVDVSDLRIASRLNGKTMQEAGTSDLIFSVPRLISFISRQFTLLPGTVVMTGTPAGVGFGRKPPVYLRPGDEIEVEIENIGSLKNPVRS